MRHAFIGLNSNFNRLRSHEDWPRCPNARLCWNSNWWYTSRGWDNTDIRTRWNTHNTWFGIYHRRSTNNAHFLWSWLLVTILGICHWASCIHYTWWKIWLRITLSAWSTYYWRNSLRWKRRGTIRGLWRISQNVNDFIIYTSEFGKNTPIRSINHR